MSKLTVNGAHSLESIEKAIRKLIDKRFSEVIRGKNGNVAAGKAYDNNLRILIGLRGEWPMSSWLPSGMATPFIPDYDALANGVSFFLLEQLLWPNGILADANPDLGIRKNGKVHWLGAGDTPPAEDFFYHFDPLMRQNPGRRFLMYCHSRATAM